MWHAHDDEYLAHELQNKNRHRSLVVCAAVLLALHAWEHTLYSLYITIYLSDYNGRRLASSQ